MDTEYQEEAVNKRITQHKSRNFYLLGHFAPAALLEEFIDMRVVFLWGARKIIAKNTKKFYSNHLPWLKKKINV